MAAWVHSEWVAHSWTMSLMGVAMTSPRMLGIPPVAVRCGTDGLVAARNAAAASLLSSQAEWLWWVDTDMGFAPDTLDRLLAGADPVERPIVGALCFSNRETSRDGLNGYRCDPIPTLYRWVEVDGMNGYRPIWDYPRDSLVEVAATGSACMVIHRSVFEAIHEAHGPRWYAKLTNPTTGQLHGEDLSFCYRAREAGARIWVDTSVKTTHLKPIWLQEADYDPATVKRNLNVEEAD